MGPEFEKGDGRLRPSLQQRPPGAEGPPEGCSTAPSTPLAAVLFPAPLRARALFEFFLFFAPLEHLECSYQPHNQGRGAKKRTQRAG